MYQELQDVAWLQGQYVDSQRTLQHIADEVGCNKTTVQRALKRHGIKRRKRTSKYPQLHNARWLYCAYVLERRSLIDIARELNTTPGNVGEHMQRQGIRRRTQREAREVAWPQGRFGPDAGNWRGGIRMVNGYVWVHVLGHPYARNNSIQEHRLVMEQQLGRYLEPYEVVHHLDGDRQNNHPDNLVVKVRGQHISEHFRASHEVLELRSRIKELEAENEQLKARLEQKGATWRN